MVIASIVSSGFYGRVRKVTFFEKVTFLLQKMVTLILVPGSTKTTTDRGANRGLP